MAIKGKEFFGQATKEVATGSLAPESQPTIDSVRQDINQALAVIAPQIRGLEDFTKVSISEATLQVIQNDLASHVRRRDLLLAVIAALDALSLALSNLTGDGYPAVADIEASATVWEELQEQERDFIAALANIKQQVLAARLSVSLGSPAEKPQP